MSGRLITVILMTMIIISCNEGEIETDNVLKRIEILKILQSDERSVDLAEIAENIKLIPLETNDEILIGEIEKIVADSINFYILDFQEKLSVFNSTSGKSVFILDKQGRGPGEFVDITDFTVSPDGSIAISDISLKKILIFGKNGQFQKEISVSNGVLSLSFINNDVLVLYTPSQLSKSYSPILSFLEIGSNSITNKIDFPQYTIKNSRFISPCNFSNINDDLRVKIPFCDTIFLVKYDNIIPEKRIDFSNMEIPVKLYSDMNMYNKNRDRYIEWSDYIESSSYFLFTVRHDKELKRGILNKITGDFFLLKSETPKKPGLTYGNQNNYLIWPEFCRDDYFLSYIIANSFLEEFTEYKDSLRFKDISINDNPIMIKGYFR